MQSTVDIIHTFVPKNSSKQLACCDKQTLIFDRAPWPLIVADTCGSVRLFAAKISSNMCYQVKAIYMHFVVQRSQLPVSLVYNSAIARSISFFCNKKPSSSSSSVANENKISPTAMVQTTDYILLYHLMSVCQEILDILQVQCICLPWLSASHGVEYTMYTVVFFCMFIIIHTKHMAQKIIHLPIPDSVTI